MSRLTLFLPTRKLLRQVVALLALLSSTGGLALFAQDSAKRSFDVPAGPAEAALKVFSEQSGRGLLISTETARAVRTQSVKGEFTPQDALARILADTGLVASQDARTGAFVVRKDADPNVPRAPATAPAAAPTTAAEAAKYDANRNGILDPDELAKLSADRAKAAQLVKLSPFEVRDEQDNSYDALETNSITRFRTELYKLPVTADVYTEQFMRDIAATTVEDMIVNFGGAGVTSLDAGAGASFSNQPGDRLGTSVSTIGVINIRGLPASVHRDGFISASPTTFGATGLSDNFSVERVDVTAGAHSLLYGNSGGGGVINMVSKQARFGREFGRIDLRLDQFGSKRGTIDGGFSRGDVAVRAAMVKGEAKYRRVNLGGDLDGAYVQVAFKLPYRSVLRLSSQYTSAFTVNSSGNGNINNFLYRRDASGNLVRDAAGLPIVDTAEPRRNLNLNLLTAQGRVGDLRYIFEPGFDLDNVDSFRGWRASTWNRDSYSNVLLETAITPWLNSQLSLAYDDALYRSPVNAGSLTPARGLPGSGQNPYDQTAISLTNPGDSETHTRIVGWRYSLLATNSFFRGNARSQTVAAGEFYRKDGAQSGVQFRYYLTNDDGSIYVNPARLTNGEYGRIRLNDSPTLWVPVQTRLVATPFHKVGTPSIQAINTVAGTPGFGQLMTWTRAQQRILNPALRSADNPIGADRTGTGEYNVGHTVSHAYSIANVTDWFDGKWQTLAGARWMSVVSSNLGPVSFTVLPKTQRVTYSGGVSYQLLSWLRPFANVSSSYNPTAMPNDPLGMPVRPPAGAAATPDFGVKFRLFDGRVNGTITYVPGNTLKDDRANIDTTFKDAINPAGINGNYLGVGGGTGGVVNVDKASSNLEATLTLSLRRNWRTRLAARMIDGKFDKTVAYPQVYNDQFWTNSRGEVTYGNNGPAVMINPTTGAVVSTGGVPLTLALINDQTRAATWANPNQDSGRIQNNTLRAALTAVGPNGATAATGATGLPISSIQYAWGDPNGHKGVITPIIGGDRTIGYSHYTFSFTNSYTFDEGWLKGLGLLTNVNASYQYRSHYYPVFGPGQSPGVTPFVNLTRQLYTRPTIATVDLGLSYSRKIWGRTFSTQVNIQNAFNHYKLLFPPNPTAATAPFVTAYVRTAEPRLWVWTNSIAF